MSHEATNWAFTVRGISPAEFRLLAILADHHNPVMGCFPEQSTLADRCEISRATVNRQLEQLERKGHIRREQRRDPRTSKQLSTRYMLAFEPGFVPLDVASRVSDCDTGAAETRVSECDTDNEPENGEGRVSETGVSVSHSSETLTCKEPTNPLPLQPNTVWDGLLHIWPQNRIGYADRARQALEALSPDDQQLALTTARTALMGWVRLKQQTPKLSEYLGNRRFAEFVGAPEIDPDGYYVITPDRPEWSAWLGDVRKQFGQGGVDRIVKFGRYLPRSRWPAGHPNARNSYVDS